MKRMLKMALIIGTGIIVRKPKTQVMPEMERKMIMTMVRVGVILYKLYYSPNKEDKTSETLTLRWNSYLVIPPSEIGV